jgi:hypothetical protein
MMGMYNLDRKLRFWATPPYAENLLAGQYPSLSLSLLFFLLVAFLLQVGIFFLTGVVAQTPRGRLATAACDPRWCTRLL